MNKGLTARSLRPLYAAVAMITIASIFTLSNISTADPGTPVQTINVNDLGREWQQKETVAPIEAAPTTEQIPIANVAYAGEVTNDNGSAVARTILENAFQQKLQGASLEDLFRVKTYSISNSMLIDRKIMEHLNATPTQDLEAVFVSDVATPEIRHMIVKALIERPDRTCKQILNMSIAQPDTDEWLPVNQLLAQSLTNRMSEMSVEDLANCMPGKPFYVRQCLVSELMNRNDQAPTTILISAFIHVGDSLFRPELAQRIIARSDCGVAEIAKMIAILEPRGKG